LAANKKLVFDFWREVLQAHHVERAPEYIADGYIQHNPNVPTGRAAFMDFVGPLPREPVKATIDDLVSIVAERDLVVLAFRRELPDLENEGQTYTTTWFDMLRIDDGKIVEHWDYGTKD
jgi:predicted SnoaL-like aldol condensation-catalyzing enzyme